MWIISILPDWTVHAILVAGVIGTVAGFVLGMIPLIQTYILPIRVVSLLLLTFGFYLEGGIAEKAIWEAKVKAVEVKLLKAEAKSQEQNVITVEKFIEKTKYIEGKAKTITEYVDREVVKDREVITYIEKCPAIPESILKSVNDAAKIRDGMLK